MLNREKYADELMNIVIDDQSLAFDKDENKVSTCRKLPCFKCLFGKGCQVGRREWLNSEYVETTVDWSKVPIDTPIWVRNNLDEEFKNGYFAGYENGYIQTWCNGTTSWSTVNKLLCNQWKYAMLAEDVDYPQVNSQWRNLKDQKPEDRQEVLTWDGISVEFDRWSDDDYFEYTDAEEIWWMELPEPPKKGLANDKL